MLVLRPLASNPSSSHVAMACHVASWSMRSMRRLTLLVLLGALWEIPPLSLSLPSREKEQRAEELEAKKREEEEKQKEKQREKEEEERIKQKQAEQEEERKRKLKELAEAETDAVKRARKEAGRPLNSFEERRVRRQAGAVHSVRVLLARCHALIVLLDCTIRVICSKRVELGN